MITKRTRLIVMLTIIAALVGIAIAWRALRSPSKRPLLYPLVDCTIEYEPHTYGYTTITTAVENPVTGPVAPKCEGKWCSHLLALPRIVESKETLANSAQNIREALVHVLSGTRVPLIMEQGLVAGLVKHVLHFSVGSNVSIAGIKSERCRLGDYLDEFVRTWPEAVASEGFGTRKEGSVVALAAFSPSVAELELLLENAVRDWAGFRERSHQPTTLVGGKYEFTE